MGKLTNSESSCGSTHFYLYILCVYGQPHTNKEYIDFNSQDLYLELREMSV